MRSKWIGSKHFFGGATSTGPNTGFEIFVRGVRTAFGNNPVYGSAYLFVAVAPLFSLNRSASGSLQPALS